MNYGPLAFMCFCVLRQNLVHLRAFLSGEKWKSFVLFSKERKERDLVGKLGIMIAISMKESCSQNIRQVSEANPRFMTSKLTRSASWIMLVFFEHWNLNSIIFKKLERQFGHGFLIIQFHNLQTNLMFLIQEVQVKSWCSKSCYCTSNCRLFFTQSLVVVVH